MPEKIVDGKAQQWTDADDAAARTYIESCYGISNRQKYEDAFTEFQHEREYDPVQTLINGIEWDGTPRVETMLIRWMGAEDTPYNRECSRLLFAGGINRAFRPGCKNDNVIVFVGKQGGGKSTFTQWLALAFTLENRCGCLPCGGRLKKPVRTWPAPDFWDTRSKRKHRIFHGEL